MTAIDTIAAALLLLALAALAWCGTWLELGSPVASHLCATSPVASQK